MQVFPFYQNVILIYIRIVIQWSREIQIDIPQNVRLFGSVPSAMIVSTKKV